MQPFERDTDIPDFERAFKEWGDRPGKLAPAIARTRVLAELPHQHRGFSWRQVLATVSLLASIVVLVYLGAPRSLETPTQVAEQAPIQTDGNVVIMVLDPQTTVYYILDSNSTPGGVS